ncbi:MAG: alpha/beta hydrolase [Clostridia bacterium]|nr:alpha/beta hydrolase [Clostridia bacterium]
MSEQAQKLIEEFTRNDDIRDAGLTQPEDVERLDDIVYGGNARWQVMDLYRPKGCADRLPVIVSVHGGGWVYGDKERYQYYCMDLARRGFAVANFTYRLAPMFKFPAPLEDLNLVMTWLKARAEERRLDMGNLFAVGDSAGAHCLGLYSDILCNPAYAARFPFTVPEGLCLRAVALNCGVYRMAPLRDDEPSLLRDYLPLGGTPEEIRMLDICGNMGDRFPPAFIMTAPQDFLKPQAAVLAAQLAEKNTEHVLRFYVDDACSLAHVFHLNIRSPWAGMCNDDECAFFRAHIV